MSIYVGDTEVISGPKRGRVIIRSGPYIIIFIEDRHGRVKKIGFTYTGQELESTSIPRRYFIPATYRANVIFRDHRKRVQPKIESEAL